LSFLLASLLSGLLLTGLFGTLVTATAQQPQPLAPLQVKIVSSPAQTDDSARTPAAASIWTDELIRQAKPYPMPTAPSGVNLLPAAPDGPAGWAPAIPPDGAEQDSLAGLAGRVQAVTQDSTYINTNSYSLFPFRAVGRVFFIMGGNAYSCSASVIGENAIWTAGHCVHPGNGDPNGWHTSWIFIPAYKDNARPYGTWQADYMYTTDQWMNGADMRYDYGVVIVKPLNGLSIRQTVGALGFAYNQAVQLARVDMGYPVYPQPQFNGQKQVISTASSAFLDYGNPYPPIPIGIASTMQGGASGGPWMLNFDITTAGGYNLLNGDNSYMYTGQNALYSPYFGDVSKTMYDCATQSTPTHKTCGSDADLALSQSARSTVLPGEPFTYTLMVQNWGALDANHLVLTDTLGLGTSLVSASLPGGTCASLGRNIFCRLALFPRWTAIAATVAVTAPLQTGATVNLAGARSDQNDYTPQDNVGVPLTVIVGRTTFMPVIGK
jgi:uncharacterized repeat protein (TIGR01451 family)